MSTLLDLDISAPTDCHAGSEPQVLDPMVDLLVELSRDGRALELAVGTGRVALAPAARGVGVAGIELSPAMVDRLRASATR